MRARVRRSSRRIRGVNGRSWSSDWRRSIAVPTRTGIGCTRLAATGSTLLPIYDITQPDLPLATTLRADDTCHASASRSQRRRPSALDSQSMCTTSVTRGSRSTRGLVETPVALPGAVAGALPTSLGMDGTMPPNGCASAATAPVRVVGRGRHRGVPHRTIACSPTALIDAAPCAAPPGRLADVTQAALERAEGQCATAFENGAGRSGEIRRPDPESAGSRGSRSCP